MPECPICRRQYDEQSSVFVPPHPEAFDTIECAKYAAAAWGTAAAPVILPTIEIVPAPPVAKPKPVAGVPGRGIAALAVLALVPGQAALAGGVGLAAAGTAAAIYLAAKPALAPHPEAASTGSSQAPETSTGGSTGGSPAGPAQGTPAARPPDAIHAAPRPSRRRAHAVVATAHIAHVTGGSSTRSSSPESAPQLISRTVPVTQEPASTPPGEQQTPASSPTSAPKPRKPKPSPQQPPATPAPPQPSTPAAPAAPVPTPTSDTADTGTRVLASTDSAPQPSEDENTPPKPPKPPKDQPPPVQTPPAQPPPGSGGCSGGSDGRPGNGWGDENHDHSGPPGQDGGHGSDGGHGGDHGDHH